MATISIQVVETGQSTLNKVYTLADADLDMIVQAYQTPANTSINGVATRAQVFLYLTNTWTGQMQSQVQQFKTTPPVVPPPITIS